MDVLPVPVAVEKTPAAPGAVGPRPQVAARFSRPSQDIANASRSSARYHDAKCSGGARRPAGTRPATLGSTAPWKSVSRAPSPFSAAPKEDRRTVQRLGPHIQWAARTPNSCPHPKLPHPQQLPPPPTAAPTYIDAEEAERLVLVLLFADRAMTARRTSRQPAPLPKPIPYGDKSRPGPEAHVDLEASADQSVAGRSHRSRPDDVSDAPLPLAYGTDSVVLMVRDPSRAHAYWDISVDRICRAVESLGGGKAFLRLLAVPTGLLLADYEVSAERGEYAVALPEAGRSYMAELALLHYGRKATLAVSDVVHAPPSVPTPTSAPAFVSRAQQRHALAHALTLGRVSDTPHLSPTQWTGASGTIRSPISLLSAGSMGSEARLARLDSQSRLP